MERTAEHRVRVVPGPDDLAELAAATIATELRRRAGEGRRVDLGLAGGSTPRTTYARLIDEEVPWDRVDAWLGDERWVPPQHPDRNGRMVREVLLAHVPARFYPPPYAEDMDPTQAASLYDETLHAVLPPDDGPHGVAPGLVLLGMGDDGHTASLFPGRPTLDVADRCYIADDVPGKGTRLTATVPLLRSAGHLLFLVAGEHKAEALAAVLEGPGDLPAAIVARGARRVTWIVDRAAASRLTDTPVETL